jgi:peptide/nickel transport system permease protein
MTDSTFVANAPAAEKTRSTHPVFRFVSRRVAAALVTLLLVSVLIFVGTEVLPGDAATAVLGRNATPAALADIRNRLDLDRPAPVRYAEWLSKFVRGDLGESATQTLASGHGTPVWNLMSGRVVNSLILAVIVTLLLVPLGLLLGVFAARHAGRTVDQAVSVSTLAAISLPEFVTGTLLILAFAVWLRLLPAVSLVPSGSGVFDRPQILVLPVATLLAASLAQTVRMIRAGMLDVLRADYVQMARLNGLPERKIVLRYALRNALAPTIQVIALNIQWLVGGIIVTESVFGYPGLGEELVQAVGTRDIPFVQSVSLIVAAIYLMLNIVADLLVVFLIPKLRTQL